MTSKFFRASYDSSHFSFEGYGITHEDAVAACMKALDKHGRQYKCARNWWTFPEGDAAARNDENMAVYQIKIGGAYRDREAL